MKFPRALRPALLAPLVLFIATTLRAAERPHAGSPVGAAYDMLATVREFKAVALSPDGRRVAWVESEATEAEPRASSLWVREVHGDGPARRVSGPHGSHAAERSPAWAPDGSSLVFVSGTGSQRSLCLVPAAGEPVKTLTRVSGTAEEPRFSADGKSIAFLCIEGARKDPGPLGPTARDAGVVDEKIEEQRIAVLDVATGRIRFVSPPELYVYEFDWSRDGKVFAATAAPGSGDNNWWIARLHTFDAATGRATALYTPRLQLANPRFSPDGSSIAFLEGLMSDFGSTAGEILTVPAAGGPPRNHTPGRKSSPAWLSWLAAPDRILFVENDGGTTAVRTLDPEGGAVETLFSSAENLTTGEGLGLSPDRTGTIFAAARDSFTSPPEVWAGPLGASRQVTRRNAALKPAWGEVKSLSWDSGGARVQGWLIAPKGIDAAKEPGRRHPMAVIVHGGPASAHRAGWPNVVAGVLASRGYYVFLPNPRGSFGHGNAFTEGNVKDFGYGDLSDVLAGVDEVVKAFPVDEKRLGLWGWSYGGYMAMWTATQTRRFGAIVAGAGISNWQSYYGTNLIDQWMLPYFGASVYDDPGVYARSSPITFIKNARTPTLILHGERDAEVPAPQGYEFWHALKALGVPTQLVIYEGEGHSIRKPAHKKDRVTRTVEWFDRHLAPSREGVRAPLAP
jgi:dipeptidyl aminopeptidase/acylaminoacyl peptidase